MERLDCPKNPSGQGESMNSLNKTRLNNESRLWIGYRICSPSS